jgi:type I restriction enzyme, R subunit
MALFESIVEDAALEWFGEVGYTCLGAEALTPTLSHGERGSYFDVVLVERLVQALRRLNPNLRREATEQEALLKVTNLKSPALTSMNREFHRLLRDGVPVEHRREDGSIAGDLVRLVDFENPEANDWLVVNQFTVTEGQHHRRPDLVVFVNGLPLGLIELKNAADEDTTIWSAYQQLQTYKAEIPALLQYNAVMVVSDGLQARIGSLTANQEWYKIWRTIEGDNAPKAALELETLIKGFSTKGGSWTCCSISLRLRRTRTAVRCIRSLRGIISFTR